MQRPETLLIKQFEVILNSRFTPHQFNLLRHEEELSIIANNVLINYPVLAEYYEVRVEIGSIKRRITFFGSLTIFLQIFSQYGSFRESYDYAKQDINSAAEYVIENIIEKEGLRKEEISKVDVDYGLGGKLIELYKRIENLEKNNTNMSPNKIKVESKEIKEELSIIIEKLGQNADIILGRLPLKYKHNLPHPGKNKQKEFERTYFILPDDERMIKIKQKK